MKVKHSLVVPCFNEGGNVKNFLAEVKKAMIGYTENYEIVFVNDGSKDETGKELKQLFKENPDVKIKVINFSRNFGKESAIYAGLSYANGEYITFIDADLQQDPKYAVEMGKILDENPDCDIVCAYQETRIESKAMIFCKTLFYKLINKITDVEFVPDASDFRTMRKSVADTIKALPEYHRFSKGIFSWVGYNTISIPYEVKERFSGESKWNFLKLLKYALDGIVSYTDVPLKLPLYFGGFLGIASVIMLIVSIVLNCTTEIAVGLLYLATLILFISAIFSIFMGIIGYYLGKMHVESKGRPIFIAKEVLSYEQD